jgi:hypothetical protein
VSAEVLRQAADRLDALAEAATPGPWTCYGDHLVWPGEQGPAANDPVLAMVGEAHEDSAPYIATMHPGVGKALAEWLRAEAEPQAFYENLTGRGGNFTASDEALAVARAILGDAA